MEPLLSWSLCLTHLVIVAVFTIAFAFVCSWIAFLYTGRIGYHHYFDKTTVLQEARVFNESPINARKCRALLTKILYLISLGETFGTTEATELFFSVTKLFQSKDVSPLIPIP